MATDYLIRFIQTHETFRKPEIDALAEIARLEFQWMFYSDSVGVMQLLVWSHEGRYTAVGRGKSPFAVIRFVAQDNPEGAAQALMKRSILGSAIFELWGSGVDYETLHKDVRLRTETIWVQYRHGSFRFEIDAFQGSHSTSEQREIIETFSYTGFEGPIRMNNADNHFTVFEEYALNAPTPKQLHLGRLVAESTRKATLAKYTLKKRNYIATTSMDAELSLVTANLTLAGPGKLAYDPFMGTASFPLACAHFGAEVFGSDLDGRSIRGKPGRNVRSNFAQYGTLSSYLGGFIADLTNSPLRLGERWLDAIICDPPYGVREGLKVLGSAKHALHEEVLLADGTPAHLSATYIPPKRPYSFTRMLDDILDFSASLLVDDGRLCMWMPVAGTTEEDEGADAEQDVAEYAIPRHPQLGLVSECTQHFNKWSRRLLTYKRCQDSDTNPEDVLSYKASRMALANGNNNELKGRADDLNSFRRKYFQGFIDPSLPRQHERLPRTY